MLRGWVHAANITDNQGAQVRVSSLAGSVAALAAGLEPVMQMTTRDRNRIALQSDLLAAGALGVPNLLLMTGDQPERGDHAEATGGVRPQLGRPAAGRPCAARRRGAAVRAAGRTAAGLPARRGGPRFRAVRTGWPRRSTTGPSSCRPSSCSTCPRSPGGWVGCATSGWTAGAASWPGSGPIRSLRALAVIAGLPGVTVPDALVRRLRGVPEDRVAAEGMAACAETVAAMRELPGLAGVHVMSVGHERGVPEILAAAGLRPVLPAT